ncbi:MAG: trypsin-like peptidase domain-containing protein [Candidatus Saccharimonadales bacterium]
MNTSDEQTKKPVSTAKHPTSEARGARRGKILALVLLMIVISFGAGLGGAWVMNQTPESSVARQSGVDGNTLITRQEKDIADVAEKVSPSVVSIITTSQRQSYFGGVQAQEGAGTGIIVTSDGYVLTNKHVVSGSDTVSVVTNDGTIYDNVKVIGVDPLNDIAFLKLNKATNLTPAKLGDSSSLRIGQSVVAIGNALGQYKNTVTSGIVSGTGRSVTAGDESSGSSETLTDLIQTDAAINPGNSGGPLVNLAGQVIGINTAIASEANGVGFSIPINAAKGLLKGVIANGTVQRAYMGVNYITITPEIAKEFNLPVQQGAYIYNSQGTAIVSGSPADKAGLKDKDIITKVNNTDVGVKGSVASLVAEHAPGDKITLTIIRDGKTQTIDVTLGVALVD